MELSDRESNILKLGLDYSFVDKSKYIKQNVAVEMEALAELVDKKVPIENKEIFHECLRKYTNVFTTNINTTKDYTYKDLKSLINNEDIVLLKGDKDTAVVIMKKDDYVRKMEDMINTGIEDGTYVKCEEDTTISDLKHFKTFLKNHFQDHPKYKKMMPDTHQPARLYGTAKTHKFENYNEITIENIKLRPITDQSGTMTYNASQVIAEYLSPLAKNEYVINDCLTFPKILADNKIGNDEEDFSYDVVSLFTNVPIDDTIKFIIDEIYTQKRLKPICSKLIMSRFLKKLVSGCQVTFNGMLIKQIDGSAMGNPLSVVLANIFMTKLERDVVDPERPILYKRYVDDVFTRKKKNQEDTLIENLNSYHPKIRFTVEKNIGKFLDTKLEMKDGEYQTKVSRNRKLPMHWSSKVPKKFKRNVINNDLDRASKISSNLEYEKEEIRKKYKNADFPKRYVESVIRQFEEKRNNQNEDIISGEVEKPFIPVKLPFCAKNENTAKHFLSKVNEFTNNSFKICVVWQTRKVRTLFKLKDKSQYTSCVIYQGTSNDNNNIKYIGETKFITTHRWEQHNDPTHDSSPAKYLRDHPEDSFNWQVLSMASTNTNKRKIHEALFINKYKPTLNYQIAHKKLNLFKNGIT